MRTYKKSMILLYLLTFFFSFAQNTYAAAKDAKISDEANLLSAEEFQSLNDLCGQYGNENQVEIRIFITTSLNGLSPENYLEDIYDTHKFGYNKKPGDAIFILLNMDTNNHDVTIQGYGRSEKKLSSTSVSSILDKVTPYLKSGDYYNGLEKMIYETSHSREQKSFLLHPAFHLIAALVIGGLSVLIMALQSGGKVTVTQGTYLDQENSKLLAKRDQYIRTTTTKRRKPQNDSNKNGGGGGISAGGHSHSGGSRSF
jgi:uncharacterized protein